MRIKQSMALILSGGLWMCVGIFLLHKGISLVLHGGSGEAYFLLKLQRLTGSLEQASLIGVSLGLLLGFFKGRFVLAKTAKKVIARIYQQPDPFPIRHLYAPSYLILLGAMMALGGILSMGILPYDVRGIVDIAIGAALANGSALYFRQLSDKKKRYL
ncbi:MAG: hypothetical protein FJZ58_00090 [Chlamydiae bacterium]|nr:hypothetical protein [Chlamydiota bacterium]